MSDSDTDSVQSFSEFRHGQDIDEWFRHAQCEEEERRQRRDAGYQEEQTSTDTDSGESENVISQSEGTSSVRGQVGISRAFKRTRDGSRSLTTVLGSEYVAGIHRQFGKGSTRLCRESLHFAHSAYPSQDLDSICQKLYQKGTFFAIARHDEPTRHYHIVHTCPWKWYQCRCFSISGGKRSIRTVELSTLRTTDWCRLLQYLSTRGRILQYLYGRVSQFKSLRGIKLLWPEGIPDGNSADEMEEREGEMQSSHNQPGVRYHSEPDGRMGRSDQEPSDSTISATAPKMRKQEKVFLKLEDFILHNLCTPLNSIVRTHVWLNSEYRFIAHDDKILHQVIDSIKSRMCHWSTEDFAIFYNNHAVVWSALNNNITDYYETVCDSVKIIYELLEFQLADIAAADMRPVGTVIKEFIQEVWGICDKNLGKKNTLELIGPASCGKSYFCNMLCDYYINVGHIKNFNRNEGFPLQGAYNKRILLWEEAHAEIGAHETCKLILGGDPCAAKIKFKDDQTISKTPVIITANVRTFPQSPPFNDRMIRYSWKPAPFLKNYKKKLHPMSWQHVLVDNELLDVKYFVFH